MSLRQGHCAEPTQKNSRRQGFADPAQGQRTERDAELDGGKKVVQILLQAAHGAGAWNGGRHHLLNPGLADRDQCELGGHKKGVGQNEHGQGDELQQRKSVHLACENSIPTEIWGQGSVWPAPAIWNRGRAECV
jgi:hypothetical protein